MSLLPDTHAMRAAAARLNGQADHVRSQAAVVRSAVAPVRWQGPAAGSFRERAGALYGAFTAAAGELDDAAAALRAHADAVDAELHRLCTDPLAAAEFFLTPADGLVADAVKAVAGWF